VNKFTEDQIKLLNEPLLSNDVKTRDGTCNSKLSYLASFHVIAEANRIFGFDGWDSEILSLTQVDKTEYMKKPYNAGDDEKPMISISYLCKLRVTVNGVIREDVGFGNGVAGNTAYGIGSCIELASKEAVTDALKRCLRYFGSKFGLTLYDKDNNAMPDLDEFEMAKTVTEDQLKKLRDLYMDRDIDDEWVMAAMKAEHYPGNTLEEMRQDWYELAYDITSKYKLEEITSAFYEEDIKSVMDMMKESANLNMLKAIFKEAWEKTAAQDDKERQVECKKIYDELKEKLS